MSKPSASPFRTESSKSRTPPAPSHLSKDSQAVWKRLQESYELADEAGQLLLTAALESRDRALQCQKELKGQPLQVADARGSVKANPLLAVEREARNAMVRVFIALRIDTEE